MQANGTPPQCVSTMLGVRIMAGTAGVGVLDWNTGSEISFSIFYLLPIAVVVWFAGRTAGVLTSIAAAVVWLFVDLFGGSTYVNTFAPYWNATGRLGIFLMLTVLLARTRFLTTNLSALVVERTAALDREIERRKEAEREVAEISREEQRRLAHELHDHLGAYLVGV